VADLVVRAYAAGDDVAVNDGFNEVFGLNRALEEWRWKYPESPEGRWIMLTAADDGTVVAHYGAVPVRLRIGELNVRAGQICDVYTRPQTRHGLAAARTYITVVRAFFDRFGAAERLAVLYGFPGERALKLGLARLGYDQMPPQPVQVWRRAVARRGVAILGHRVREGFDAHAVDGLWQRSQQRYPVAAVRDAAWVARRFTGRPGVAYTHLVAYRRGRPAALAVVRPLGGVMAVAELIWDGADERALAALDRAACARARTAGVGRAEMWLDGDDRAEAAFAALGWKPETHPDRLVMVARSFDPRIDVAGFAGRFYLTMGDSDLV
jgi:Acetyltransferase (GNAT) domain